MYGGLQNSPLRPVTVSSISGSKVYSCQFLTHCFKQLVWKLFTLLSRYLTNSPILEGILLTYICPVPFDGSIRKVCRFLSTLSSVSHLDILTGCMAFGSTSVDLSGYSMSCSVVGKAVSFLDQRELLKLIATLALSFSGHHQRVAFSSLVHC